MSASRPNTSFLYGPSSLRTFTSTTATPSTVSISPASLPPSVPSPSPRAPPRRTTEGEGIICSTNNGTIHHKPPTDGSATLTNSTLSMATQSGGGTYRLASLDRLAMRQRLYDHNGVPDSSLAMLQNKRELFFKNDSSVAANNSSPSSTSLPPSLNNPSPILNNVSTTSLNNSNPHPHSHPNSTHPNAPVPPPKDNVLARTAALKDALPEDNRERERFKDREREKDKEKERRKEVDGYVGFANLPNQVYRKAVKRGFDFTLMVVGESGLGKSTLINSMFLADIYSAEYPGPSRRVKKTVQVETSKVVLKENGVNLCLTIVDTPGFGDAVDNSNCWQPITDHIESKYEEYLNGESRVRRVKQADSRVHCCLYFIAPSGHGLKPLDVEFMRRLHDKVNIIPVIAKADTMMPDECAHFKKQILNEISQHKILIYEFPECDDPEENKTYKQLKERVPFAIVGSNTVMEVDGRKVRGRRYPWGTVEVENMEHCDFIPLRNLLVRTHMQDLKEVTNNVHYENFRCRKLAGLSEGKARPSNKNPLAQMEEEKKDHELKMKKMESEMEQVFEMKVKEKRQKLKDSEIDLQRRHEQMKKGLELQQKELEDKRKTFDMERVQWESATGTTMDELRRRSLEATSKEQVDGKVKEKKKKGLF